jgi:hypothetical protein
MRHFLVYSIILLTEEFDPASVFTPERFGTVRIWENPVNVLFMSLHAVLALKLLLANPAWKQLTCMQSHVLTEPGHRFKHLIAEFAY